MVLLKYGKSVLRKRKAMLWLYALEWSKCLTKTYNNVGASLYRMERVSYGNALQFCGFMVTNETNALRKRIAMRWLTVMK